MILCALLTTAWAWADSKTRIVQSTAVSAKAKLANGSYNSSPYIVVEVVVQNDGRDPSKEMVLQVRLVPKGRKPSREGNSMDDPLVLTAPVPVLQPQSKTCLSVETPYRSADEFRSSVGQFSCCNIDPSGSSVRVQILPTLAPPP